MATQTTSPQRVSEEAAAPAPAIAEQGRGIAEHWRSHSAERKRARLISARNRRVLAQWLRRTANRNQLSNRLARTPEPLLHYRAAAVRTDLLEIAAMVERTHNPDPQCIAALRDLLANGCDSPLYNSDIHVSELHATLDYVRSGL